MLKKKESVLLFWDSVLVVHLRDSFVRTESFANCPCLVRSRGSARWEGGLLFWRVRPKVPGVLGGVRHGVNGDGGNSRKVLGSIP